MPLKLVAFSAGPDTESNACHSVVCDCARPLPETPKVHLFLCAVWLGAVAETLNPNLDHLRAVDPKKTGLGDYVRWRNIQCECSRLSLAARKQIDQSCGA